MVFFAFSLKFVYSQSDKDNMKTFFSKLVMPVYLSKHCKIQTEILSADTIILAKNKLLSNHSDFLGLESNFVKEITQTFLTIMLRSLFS